MQLSVINQSDDQFNDNYSARGCDIYNTAEREGRSYE
jgi:hypothetical protein